ncbi:MAG: hypothetical protein HN742_26450 [Lentisphaerae bacterium]|jgi:hypothetical protein|nr:hypothetical protein [Lentisphaerota bacterium]MBT4818840.1 hypothetical protein [Lentisphaerota bacterium]MBT5606004.1 hypothetical protein [Lentisphaerota bacterium]MBT7058607.1 hypothetical protein [Lentisphaerota bacterium]MBT7845443.1 hypothetical protein [Lentisphaerota bacterium]
MLTAEIGHPPTPHTPPRVPCPLSRLPLLGLAQRIARHSDRQALHEFHNERTPFRRSHGSRMRFVEFLSLLRSVSARERPTELVDRAHDLTLDKFMRLPAESSARDAGEGERGRLGIDCRRYFLAFSEAVNGNGKGDELWDELTAANVLQNFVSRHFRLSLYECLRSTDRTRYVWRVNGSEVTVLMPRGIAGSQRRAWLQAHVPNPDLSRPGGRDRIQVIIDESLGTQSFHSLDADDGPLHLDGACEPAFDPWSGTSDVSMAGLAEAVANEKAANIDAQRTAIRALGPSKLRKLVLEIFAELSNGTYSGQTIAKRHGLSPPTFSRFAGLAATSWKDTDANGPRIPDLWANTAYVLTMDPVFMEVVDAMGLLGVVNASARQARTARKGGAR